MAAHLAPAAIVGYSHRLPGGLRSDADFWHLLKQREIVQVPIEDRYGRGHGPIGPYIGPDRCQSPFEGLIPSDDAMLFDHAFFGMSYNETRQSDPQTRLMLNCAWEAIEHVGWDLTALWNSPTGVFIGSQTPTVANWRPLHGPTPYTASSTSLAMLANRISFHFNLMGSSATYCTACSAGITALHAAMHALTTGECARALVGAALYLSSARLSSAFAQMGIIGPDGVCYSFDARANGYMRSEGAFVFAIKRLKDAERDGDRIYAVIETTAVNAAGAADGAFGTAPGRFISAPTRHSQVALMQMATARAGRTVDEIDYVEAHATGTSVGDPIEGNAISEAFQAGRKSPLRVSSVKSNVGHMEAAAFACSLLKVVLMIRHRTFAPISKTFQIPNPAIDFDSCPMRVQTECEPFPDHPVTIGINSFGFGGANGHCVVREYRPERKRIWSTATAPKAGFMIPLSARSPSALVQSARRLRTFIDDHAPDLYTLAGNLSRRRTAFAVRAAFAVRSSAELTRALKKFETSDYSPAAAEDGHKSIAMVFSGQGTQWAGCGRVLYESHPVFRRVIDRIEAYWVCDAEYSLRESWFNAPQEDLDQCKLAQPVIFAVQCGLVELLKTWGIFADCVVGHSSGEIAAAYTCGGLSLEEATRLVYHRSMLQQRVAGSGRMLSIGLDVPGVKELLESAGVPILVGARSRADAVQIACENSPANTVLCGPLDALQPVLDEARRRNLQHTLIPGNIAFHSAAMEDIRDDVLTALKFLNGRTCRTEIPFVSTVTGLVESNLDAAYWWSNVRQPVHFSDAISTVLRSYQPSICLEISPHSALQPLIRQCADIHDSSPVTIGSLMRQEDDGLQFHETVARLFEAGVSLDFAAQYPRPAPMAHLLPGHAREESRLVDKMLDDEVFHDRGEYGHGPLVGHRIPAEGMLFEARLSESAFPWLTEHRILDEPLMPGAGFVEMILQVFKGQALFIEQLEFLQRCHIPKTPVRLQTSLQPIPHRENAFTFSISSQPYESDTPKMVHARGTVCLDLPGEALNVPATLAEIDQASYEPLFNLDRGSPYDTLHAVLAQSISYGPSFRNITQVSRNRSTDSLLSYAEMDESLWAAACREGYVLFPTLLDAGYHTTVFELTQVADLIGVPLRSERLTFFAKPTSCRLVYHIVYPRPTAYIVDEKGQPYTLMGEWDSGSISCYDADTGKLVLHVDAHKSMMSEPGRADLKNSKHYLFWQPKFVHDHESLTRQLPPGDLDPSAVLKALQNQDATVPRMIRALEFAGSRDPDQTALFSLREFLPDAQCEYWLCTGNQEHTQAHFDAFHTINAPVRFISLDESSREAAPLEDGLLRRKAVELIVAYGQPDARDWQLWHEIAVSGGLVLIFHDNGASLQPDRQWELLSGHPHTTLLKAKRTARPVRPDPAISRWIIGGPASWVPEWAALMGSDSSPARIIPSLKHADFSEDEAIHIQAIDVFPELDTEDETGAQVVVDFVQFVQSLIAYRMGRAESTCRLTLVTRNAVMDVRHPGLTALWGAIRSIALEFGHEALLDCRLVDITQQLDLQRLAELACTDLRERELAIRDGRFWTLRLCSTRQKNAYVPESDDPTYRLVAREPGQISGVCAITSPLAKLNAEDVEVDVKVAALNFRDIMVALGLLPGLAFERSAIGKEIGMEAGGVVRRTGSAVRTVVAGDEVVIGGGGLMGNRAVVNQHQVFSKPHQLSLAEAGCSMSVYATAYYALIYLARLREGQNVLIHSAMGGVGQAAIALARYVGATIYATAGNKDKRAALRKLGVAAAFDSRSTQWYDGLMAATNSRGVDIVLNALAGPHIPLCLKALRPGGLHCEIGKVDIYADSQLSMRIFRKNLRFAAIDMDRLILDDPVTSRQVSEACADLLAKGLVPPIPVSVFPFADFAEAMRLMMSGQHTGKLALEIPPAPSRNFPVVDTRPFLDPEATYLVTGGFGGLGTRILGYLVCAGARHITLMDRDSKRARSVQWLRERSVLKAMDVHLELDIVQGDVSSEADVHRCVREVKRPLKGVFHLAGIKDDVLLPDLTAESILRTFSSKARGALFLHRATVEIQLDYFVLFSSISASLGNVGQTNYCAANAFLDGLAALRRRQGLPALSYQLAAISDAGGMAADKLGMLNLMHASGMPPVSCYFAVNNLDFAIRDASHPEHLMTALFKKVLWTVDSTDYLRTGHVISNQAAFETGKGHQLTVDGIMAQIARKVADLCGHSDVSVDDPLSSFGLSSIATTELGAFIHSEFRFHASALELMTTATCRSLAIAILSSAEADEEMESDAAQDSGITDGRTQPLEGIVRKPSEFAIPLEDHFPVKSNGSHQIKIHS